MIDSVLEWTVLVCVGCRMGDVAKEDWEAGAPRLLALADACRGEGKALSALDELTGPGPLLLAAR